MAIAAPRDLRVVNPATLECVATVPVVEPEAVPALVSAARVAQERWAEVTPTDRRAFLERLSAATLDAAGEIADCVVAESGKPRTEAFTTELAPALDALRWLAGHAARVLAPERLPYPQLHLKHKRGRLVYEPLGVVGVIAPWNFPFSIPFVQTAYALAAGNAVVLKPSELTPLSGALVARVVADAGAPAGLVQVAQGDGAVGSALVAAGVDKLLFTGSPAVGRRVAAEAGARLVPVTLELGGKDPMIVLDDADLPRAVEGALWAAFVNCGQTCVGVERVYVESSLYEPFAEELARRARGLRLGVDLGPLVSEEQRARVVGLVEDAVGRGARLLAGGAVPDRNGFYFEPTVLADVPAGARVADEETFGPVVTVARVADEDAAVRAANGVRYGLGASVWTRSPARAARLAGLLRAGSVWHNDHAYSFAAAQAPWGGRGESGFGRTHSRHGLYDLTSVKLVDRDAGRLRMPWWFPYGDDAADGFAAYLRVLHGSGRVRSAWRERRALLALARRYRRPS